MNRLGDTSAFVIPAVQLLLTRRGKTKMYTVGIVFLNSIQCPFNILSRSNSMLSENTLLFSGREFTLLTMLCLCVLSLYVVVSTVCRT